MGCSVLPSQFLYTLHYQLLHLATKSHSLLILFSYELMKWMLYFYFPIFISLGSPLYRLGSSFQYCFYLEALRSHWSEFFLYLISWYCFICQSPTFLCWACSPSPAKYRCCIRRLLVSKIKLGFFWLCFFLFSFLLREKLHISCIYNCLSVQSGFL